MINLLKILLVFIFIVQPIFPAESKSLSPLMLNKGKLVFQEDFSKGLDKEKWTSAKGKWTVVKGVLKGVELKEDKHAAAIRADAPIKNSIIEFSFKLDGSSQISLSLNDDHGHNSRVVITPDDFVCKKDKDKKDPASFPAVLGECGYKFKKGKWYTMLVEIYKDEFLARIDDRVFILGSHPGIKKERVNFGLPTTGDSASYDNIRIWAGTSRKDWSTRKKKLLKAQGARAPVDRSKNPKAGYTIGESILRGKLLREDKKFKQMVDNRSRLESKIKTAYPRAFKRGSKGADERKRLVKEDAEFKKLSRELNQAKKAEREYIFRKDPNLEKYYNIMREAQKRK